MIKSAFVDSPGEISPKGGAGSNGGVLNTQGDEGVIGQVSFHNVPSFGTSVMGAAGDPATPSTEPAGGSKRPGCEVVSAFEAPFGK